MLPPLVIDTDALRGAITAVSAGLIGLAGLHGVILLGLRAGRGWAHTAGVLLAGVLTMLFVALSVAAATSSIADPPNATWLLLASLTCALGAIGYAVVTLRLVSEIRARGAA
jgi:hypothetical protein